MVLLLDLVQALNELRLLLLVTGRCYLVLELSELPLIVDDLGRITNIVVAMPTVAVFAHFTADWTLTGSRASWTVADLHRKEDFSSKNTRVLNFGDYARGSRVLEFLT